MKFTSLLIIGCLLAPALHAFAPYPSVLTAKYKDKMLPVVHVIGTDPVVLFDGKEKRIRDMPYYLLQRADGFSDHYVEAVGGRLGGELGFQTINGEKPDPRAQSGMTYFEANLVSKKTLKGGFTIVTIYAMRNFTHYAGRYNHPEVVVHELPDLPAGKTVRVKFTGGGTENTDQQFYFIQFFDQDGHEVLTNGMAQAWRYFALRDLSNVYLALQKYMEKFKGLDHAPVPALVPKPILLNGLEPPKGPVAAVFTISAIGQVSEVEVEGVEDGQVRQAIIDSVGGWLFLPKLEAGQPVVARVKVPVQF